MNNINLIIKKLDELIPNPICSLNYNTDYELLISVMLSAQSTDARVNTVTPELFKYSLYDLSTMSIEKIENIIKPVGTYHRKALYIKKIASQLLESHNGKVPHDRSFVEALPGVGHKTCNVVFAEFYKEPTMPVDTHVARVSKRLGFANYGDSVIEIENKLKKIFPKQHWNRLHLQFVLFGRNYCKAIKPKCLNCLFKNICNYKNEGK